MTKFKDFRLLSPAAMVELLPEDDISGSNATLCVQGLSHTFPPEYFETLVKQKKVFSTLVLKDGKIPVYRVIYDVLVGNTVSVLVAQQLTNDTNDIRLIGLALDKIAALHHAANLIFSTSRKALVKQTQCWGAEVFQVWMKKEYLPAN